MSATTFPALLDDTALSTEQVQRIASLSTSTQIIHLNSQAKII